ncbi:MAG: hypothetical protein COB22_06015 [Cycloclasticus sp.]|nr:MAG: hypothetical protein COB22_06015 [Cycloclasticus sp.]
MEYTACPSCGHEKKAGEFGVKDECNKCGASLNDQISSTPRSDEVDFKKLAEIRRKTRQVYTPKFQHEADEENQHTAINQRLALIAACMLLFGVFTPLLSVPLSGGTTLLSSSPLDAWGVLIVAAISVFYTTKRKYKFHFYAGLVVLADLVFSIIRTYMKIKDAKETMMSDLAGNPFKGVAEAALSNVQIQWGWGVLLVGAALLVAADCYREKD